MASATKNRKKYFDSELSVIEVEDSKDIEPRMDQIAVSDNEHQKGQKRTTQSRCHSVSQKGHSKVTINQVEPVEVVLDEEISDVDVPRVSRA